MNTDLELLSRICNRDTNALAELYDQYGGRVYSLAVAILGDVTLAQEVAQDAFMRVWQHAKGYKHGDSQLVSWLLTITRHAALDRLRHERRRSGQSTSIDDDNFPELHDSTQDDEARWRDLQHLMDGLPIEQREVIVLAFYRGMSNSETALHLGVPLGTVKTRMRLGMEKLREAYSLIR